MKNTYNIDLFDFYLIRNPIYNLKSLQNIRNKQYIECLYSDDFVKRIIFSSEPLYNEILKKKEDKKRSVELSLLKYYIRASSRCTPFELYSTYTLAQFTQDNKSIILSDPEEKCSFNSSYLNKLIEDLKQNKDYEEYVNFYTNPTLNKIGNHYHYIEISKNSSSNSSLSKIDYNPLLRIIFDKARNGLSKNEILKIICRKISTDQSLLLFNELYESNAIINELDCTSKNYFFYKRIYNIIRNKIIENPDSKNLFDKEYLNLFSSLNNGDLNSDKSNSYKYITIDLKRKMLDGGLNKNQLLSDISTIIKFYRKFFVKLNNNKLSNFKKEFADRYGENRFVPILDVLDPIIGIEYPPNNSFFKKSELLNDLNLNRGQKVLNNNYSLLELLISSKTPNKTNEIYIDDKDLYSLENIDEITYKSSKTYYIQTELFYNKSKEIIFYLKGIGGRTATEPLTRYYSKDNIICENLYKISEYEYTDKAIVVDIHFQTNNKIDNIAPKQNMRNYELFFNTIAGTNFKNVIHISDIHIAIEHDNLKLYSKTLKKYIIPLNSSVLNTEKVNNYLLQFLSDYSNEINDQLVIPLSGIFITKNFIPRIKYKNYIFYPASWSISQKEIDYLKSIYSDSCEKDIINKISKWRDSRNIPERVMYNLYDQCLVIDFKCINGLNIFFSIIKKNKKIWISEFLYDYFDSISKDSQGNYLANEIFFFLKNNNDDN